MVQNMSCAADLFSAEIRQTELVLLGRRGTGPELQHMHWMRKDLSPIFTLPGLCSSKCDTALVH